MSYCRWSSDDFQSDVYVYDSCDGGTTIHVAGKRRLFKAPLPPKLDTGPFDAQAFCARHKTVMDMCDDSELVDIGLEYDGKDFYGLSHEDAAQTLEMLRDAGYYVPDGVIEELRETPDYEGDDV